MQIEINWANVSDNPEIIGYLKIREYIADLIFKLDKDALIKYELEALRLPSRYNT
jgi:hypothetical protein